MQIFAFKVQDFFQPFSKTTLYFSRLKVTKQVINRDLEKCRNQAFFPMYWKCTVTKVQCGHKRVMKFLFLWLNSWLRARLNGIWLQEKIDLLSTAVALKKKNTEFLPFFQTLSLSSSLFPGLKSCFANLRLFQEFKTVWTLCIGLSKNTILEHTVH